MARPARARTVGGVEESRRAFWVVSVASSRERRERWVVKRAWGERWGLGDGIVILDLLGISWEQVGSR